MEEQDPDVVNAAYILCSFKSKTTAPKPKPKSPRKTMISLRWAAGRRIENETVPKSPPRMMSLPPAGRKKGRSTKRSRSCSIGWIAAMDAANIVAQKTAEVQEAKVNGGGRSSPDSPLYFLLNSDATVKKARREEAESSATTEEEKQKLRTDREEQLKRKKENRLASFLIRCQLAPTCADGEGTALLPSSSSSSLQASRGDKFLSDPNLPTPLDDQSQGVKFLFDLNLLPPDDR